MTVGPTAGARRRRAGVFRAADAAADCRPPRNPRKRPRSATTATCGRIFQQHCQGCHQPAKPQGGYVMTSYADLLKTGDHDQPGIVPGKPDKSYLVEQITAAKDGKPAAMPKSKDPLPTRDVDLIKKWIAAGRQGRHAQPPPAIVIDAEHPPVYELPPVITSLDYSPDGTLLAVAGYHEVLLHKADGSGLVGRLVGLSERIQSLAFSPDGKLLAVAGGSPGRFGEVQIWDVAKQEAEAVALGHLRHALRRQLVARRHARSPSAAPTTRCGPSTPRPASRCSSRAPTTTGCWARSSRKDSHVPRLGQPRPLDEADRGGHAALHRQHHQHHAGRPQGRPAGRGPRSAQERDQKVKVHAAGTDTTAKWLRRAADRRLRRRAAAVQDAPRHQARHRRRRQQDPRVSRRCRAASSPLAFSTDGSLFAAGSSLDGTGRGARLPDGRRQAGVEVRRPDGRRLHAWPSAPTARRSPRPASTAWCA